MTIHKRLNSASNGAFNMNNTNSGCCPDDGTTCRYSYLFDDDGTTLVSIVVDGVVVALDNIDPTQDLAEFIVALEAKLKAAGYTSDQYVSITAWRGADSLEFSIFSSAVFGDLVLDPAATLEASVNCVATPLCYFEFSKPVSAAVDFDLEFGRTGTVVGGNVAGDYSTGAADTLRDDIIALFALETYEGVALQIERVVVTENFGEEKYYIGLWIFRPEGGNLFVDGEIVAPVRCSPNYSQAV